MSYFVRHINDTPAASAANTAPANTAPANNEVRRYFNPGDRTSVHPVPPSNEIPSASSKAFTSDGLCFRRNKEDPETVSVCAVAAASTAYHVVIPSRTTHLGLTVTAIGESCFSNASRLKSVTIPASVTEIADRAFAGSSLESITLLASIQKIGKEVFSGCTQLSSVDASSSSVKALEENVFKNCPSLKNIALPFGLMYIGDGAFENCFALREIVIPDQVVSLGERVLKNCKSLEKLQTGAALKEIGDDAFGGCVALKELVNPPEALQDNVQHYLKDTALYKNADYDYYGAKSILGCIVDVTEPAFDYYRQRLPEARVIAPYAFLNCKKKTLELPKSVRLFMPNALVQRETVKIMENGVVKTVEGLGVMNIVYGGTVADWRAIAKLHAQELYPVCVTCVGEKEKTTFIDYV